MGAIKTTFWAVIGVLVISVPLSQCAKEMSANAPRQSRTSATPQPLSDCLKQRTALTAEYNSQFQKGQYWAAANHIRPCAAASGDKELGQMVAQAESQDHLKTMSDRRLGARERLQALEQLERDHPQIAAASPAVKQLRPQLRAAFDAQERREAAALAAEKRKRGVLIGMSKSDVLASSWGRPTKINRTTNAYGTREQWVYEGGYLYFENDLLTAIQN